MCVKGMAGTGGSAVPMEATVLQHLLVARKRTASASRASHQEPKGRGPKYLQAKETFGVAPVFPVYKSSEVNRFYVANLKKSHLPLASINNANLPLPDSADKTGILHLINARNHHINA